MKKKLPALFALCVLAIAGSAQALQTDELIAITTMPLAVADVVALPSLPQDEFFSVVTTLNRAEVSAPQFIEVVRYAPVALIEPAEPTFVTYVTQEYDRGVIGEPLALAIADRYETYGFTDVDVVNPPVMTVVQRQILPEVVVTRFQPAEFDPLALIAMPLAVAAVAELTDVPQSDLFRFVASLNQAMVPAPQFVEIVRYSPVVFVDRTAAPQFVQFVTTEIDRGIVGRPLAFTIAHRLRDTQGVDIDVLQPHPVVVVDRDFIVDRNAARSHPHGGPPGQLKKQLGLQTGAEVVHGTSKRRNAAVTAADQAASRRREHARRVRVSRRDAGAPEVRVKPAKVKVERAKPQRVVAPPNASPGRGKNPGHGGGNNGHGGGQDKGKGKGKGKG